MNIDKFGHHVHKRLRQSDTTEGDIDLHFARLKGLQLPKSTDEAANKAYVDQLIKSVPTKQEMYAELKKIKNEIDSLLTKFNQKYYTKAEINSIVSKAKQQP